MVKDKTVPTAVKVYESLKSKPSYGKGLSRQYLYKWIGDNYSGTSISAVRRAITKGMEEGTIKHGKSKSRFQLTDAGKTKWAPKKKPAKKKPAKKPKKASKKKKKKVKKASKKKKKVTPKKKKTSNKKKASKKKTAKKKTTSKTSKKKKKDTKKKGKKEDTHQSKKGKGQGQGKKEDHSKKEG